MKAIVIPDRVTSIGTWAFEGCSELTEITIPDSVTSIGAWAFSGTSWLTFKQTENPLVIVNGILIDGKICSGDVVIPDSVTSVGDYAFERCLGLKTITIPNSVTSIGYGTFRYCNRLTEITILNPNCEIGDGADTIQYADTIYGYDNSTAQEYAEKYDKKFVSLGEAPDNIMGDVNDDGIFNISDVVLLQKWLLAVPNTHLVNWKAADLCEDGRLDVFDLCLLKRKLIQ